MNDSGLSFPDQPRVELDRRLSELVEAANEVLATQGRLRALLRANQAITAELDLDSVLRTVVEAARDLAGARFAALGVLGEHGGIERFIHVGMPPEDAERIGHLPRGAGLLGAVIADQQPIRIPDIGADPRSVGFPEGHPAMREFLGVPIRIRGSVYGNLYLTERGGIPFTEEDEQLVRSLAVTAGYAIENARLYRETRRRQEWMAASAEISGRMLAPQDGEALPLIASRVQSLAKAMSTFVVLVTEDGEHVAAVDVQGEDPNGMRGVRIPLDTTLVAETVRTGASRRMEEHELRALGRPQLAAFGPVMVLPLGGSGRVVGALVVARAPGAPPFTDSELAAATDFGARAGVALELVRVRREAERVLLYEDRSRIARDLHDRVIQQLFATGMQLQGVLGTLPPGRNAERIDAAIASLDDSITQIRRVIFTLESTARGQERASGRQLLFDLIERLSVDLSVEPTLRISGPIDAVLDGDLAEDVLAVVQEGLSNAVRHAAASDIGVEVQADRHGVSVTVTNDGLPLAPSGRRSGLGNLEERAARRSGSMVLDSEQGRTVLRWAVPLRRSRSHQ